MRPLTVYGDSIAAGVGAAPRCGCVPDLARLLARRAHKAQYYLNFGQSGLTTWDLASGLSLIDGWAQAVPTSRAIAVIVGGDDVIHDIPVLLQGRRAADRALLVRSIESYRRVLQLLCARRRCAIAVATVYNPFPNTPLAQQVIDLYNDSVILPAAAAAGVAVAHVHAAFAGNQAALIHGYRTGIAGAPGAHGVRYPVHPNSAGHQVIAETFAACL
ncbi:MAG: SGNH/GDSL hydrolase family protein [Firmicutes bacterium]|nr:SGNH/GDSL hydrolase family protein [Bacillota bacterium]